MLYEISNINLQNFLEENRKYPVVEDEKYNIAWYKKDDKLLQLLDAYNIRYKCFPNNQRIK